MRFPQPMTSHRATRDAGQGHLLGLILVGCLGLGLLYVGFRIGRDGNGDESSPRLDAVAPDPLAADQAPARPLASPGDSVQEPREQATPAASSPPERIEPKAAGLQPSAAPRSEDRRDVEDRMERLRELRRGEDPAVRLALAREILAQDEAGPLIVHALQTLAELDPSAASDEIRRRLELETDRPGGDAMMAMVIGMVSINEEAVSVDDLASFYDQGDRSVQLAAAQALRARGDESLTRRFQERCKEELASDDAVVRAEAVRQLTSSRAMDSVPLVLPLLRDENEQVRMQALRSLGQGQPTPEILENIRGLLEDPSEKVQRSARRMLANLERRRDLRQR